MPIGAGLLSPAMQTNKSPVTPNYQEMHEHNANDEHHGALKAYKDKYLKGSHSCKASLFL